MARSLTVKENAAELLDQELSLRARKGQYGIIVLSSATDPYLQIDVETGLTRKLLEIIHHHRFPVHIITKSDGVLRDLDLLERIGREALLPTDLEDKLPGGVSLLSPFPPLIPRWVPALNPVLQIHLHALKPCVR